MPRSCSVLVASSPPPMCSSRVASDLSGGAGFTPPPPPPPRDAVVPAPAEVEVARGGMFMLRTDSRMIWRIVFRNALRNSPVLKEEKGVEG